MDRDLFELGADVDADTLIARIRDTARKRKVYTPTQAAEGGVSESIRFIEYEGITEAIHSAGSLAETINQVPIKSRGWKGRLEIEVKKFLKWLVHWNTKAQADFNRSTIRALGLIAQHLRAVQRSSITIEESLRETEKRLSSSWEQTMNQEIESLREAIRESREHEINQEMESLREALVEIESKLEKICVRLLNLEQLGEETERNAKALRQSEEGLERLSASVDEIIRMPTPIEELKHLSATVEEISKKADAVNSHLSGLGQEMDEMRMRVLRSERVIRRIGHNATNSQASPELGEDSPKSAAQDLGHPTNGQSTPPVLFPALSNQPPEQSFDYFMFEHRFRGPVSEIKLRQSAYLDYFLGKEHVLDLGCGRGEFVELLTENGVNVTGVDNDEDMFEFCRDRGLRVVLMDMFEYLSGLPDESLDGVFVSQVVEHIPPEQILRLINMCAKKLRLGGVAVAETINTNCIVALSNFYLDPTHVRPVPADMLRFMFEQASFKIHCLKFSSPIPGSNGGEVLDVTGGVPQESSVYQDYAVVAFRR